MIDQLSCKTSVIMRINNLKWPTGHGLSLCETLHFVLFSWSRYFFFLTTLISQNYSHLKWPLTAIFNCLLPKVFQVIG